MTFATTTLAVQLATLSGDRDRGERLALGMSQLGAAVAGAVPSWLAVSTVLERAAGRITVSTLVPGTESTGQVMVVEDRATTCFGHRLPLAHRHPYPRGLPAVDTPTRQARRTRAFLVESTT